MLVYLHSNLFIFGHLVGTNRLMSFLESSAKVKFWISSATKVFKTTPICHVCMSPNYVQLEPTIHASNYHHIMGIKCANYSPFANSPS